METRVTDMDFEKPRILVVDDDLHMLDLLKTALGHNGLVPLVATDCKRALRLVSRTPADLAIVDYRLPQESSGIELVKLMRRADARLPVIMITGYSSEDLAIVALKEGINDYFPKPFQIDDLLASIRRLLSVRTIGPRPTSSTLTSGVPHPVHGQPLVGESPPMRENGEHTSKVASTDNNVLINSRPLRVAAKLTSIRSHPVMQDILDLISNTADGAVAIDRERRIILWNKAAEMLLGFKAEEVIGKLCFHVIGGTNELGCLACRKACLDVSLPLRQELVPTRDLQMWSSVGREIWVSVSTVLVPSRWRTQLVLIHFLRDIGLQKELEHAVNRLLSSFSKRTLCQATAQPMNLPVSPLTGQLTRREHEVLRLLASGVSTQAIAARLFISPATVRNHISHILANLGTHSRLEAITLALRTGLI